MNPLLIVTFLSAAQLGCASQAVNLHLYDAFTKAPLSDAGVTLYVSHPPKEFFGSRWSEKTIVPEDGKGNFSFSYPLCSDLHSSLAIHKHGYYYKSHPLPKKAQSHDMALTLFLMPKQQPISLITAYWNGLEVEFSYEPKENVKYYDCLKANWLPPDGDGINADIAFSLQRYRKHEKTFAWFKIRFTNPNDGFEEITEHYAEGMRIREATLTTHLQNQLDFIVELHDWLPQSIPPLKNYAFRVRTHRTPSGELLSANYGKFYDAFNFGYTKNAWHCGFEYYLNPTPNDRNLEYNGRSINKPKGRVNEIRRIR